MPAKTKQKPRKSTAASAGPQIVSPKTANPKTAKAKIVNPKTVKKTRILASSALPAPNAPRRTAKLNFAVCILLALTTFAVYFRATGNPFVNYDDQAYVVENAQVQQGLTAATFRWAFTSTYASNWHPLTWLSHALDCQLFGLNPAGHHLTSLLLHIFSVVILFLILTRATGSTWRSLMVAALFALHPINVESVAWVAERKNVLSMFFLLLTLGAYGWYARRPNVRRYVVPLVLFALALAAKPMVVTLPFLLLLVDFWPLQRVLGGRAASEAFPVRQFPLSRLALEKLPFLLLSAASSVITVVAQRSVISTNEHLPFLSRLANATYAYSMYIAKTLWPAYLASFYPYEGLRLAPWKVLLFVLFLAGITAWVWRERSHLYLPVGWLWFLGSLVPMIGLVQVGDQAMADRYAYLPLLGIFCMVVWGLADLREKDLREKKRFSLRTSAALAGIALAVLSFLTWRQIGIWRSSYDLWSHALEVTRDNYMAEDYVGTSLLVQQFEATGQRYSAEALVHFQNAVRINPQDPISHLNLGADLQEHGRLQEALQQYQTVLDLTQDPHLLVKTFIDLGAVSHQLGDFAGARRYDLAALKMEQGNVVAFENLGKLAMDERIQELTVAAATAPSATAYLQLGQLQQAAEHIPAARVSYQQALKLDPQMAEARRALDALQ
jgi:tetratricopeptide (TPR) repeat protein